MKKLRTAFLLSALVLGLASCSSGEGDGSDTYSPPGPTTVLYYDDSPEPQRVGFFYGRPGAVPNPTLDSGYDFLSNDEARIKALGIGKYLTFDGWVLEDGTKPVFDENFDWSKYDEQTVNLYASFVEATYDIDFYFRNAGEAIRDNEDRRIVLTAEWGSTESFPTEVAHVEKVNGSYALEYTHDGWLIDGIESTEGSNSWTISSLNDLGWQSFTDTVSTPVSKTLYVKTGTYDEFGQPLYPVYVYDPNVSEGSTFVEIGDLSENLQISLDAHFSTSTAVHAVSVSYDDTKVTMTGTTTSYSIEHAKSLAVSRNIVGGNYELGIGDDVTYSMPIAGNEGYELDYEAVYTDDAAPHLAGFSANLDNVLGPIEVTVKPVEKKHTIYVYENDVSGVTVSDHTLPAGTSITVNLTEGLDAENRTVVNIEGSWAATTDNTTGTISFLKNSVVSYIATVDATDSLNNDYPFTQVDLSLGSAQTTTTGSFLLTSDVRLYADVEGDYDIELFNGHGVPAADAIPDHTLKAFESTVPNLAAVTVTDNGDGTFTYKGRVTIGLHTYDLTYTDTSGVLSLELYTDVDEANPKTRIYLRTKVTQTA